MSEQSTRTVERALSMMAHVCEQGTVSLADTARAVHLSPSTTLRLLRTLESTGFVRRNDAGEYAAGPRLVQLGAHALAHESLVGICRDEMVGLRDATGESVYLSVQGHADTVLYIDIVEGFHSIRHTNWVGRSIPIAGSAAGLVFTGRTTEHGFVVVERGIEPDVTALAAPIRAAGRVRAAMSVLVPTYRVDSGTAVRIGGLLAAASTRITALLEGSPASPRHRTGKGSPMNEDSVNEHSVNEQRGGPRGTPLAEGWTR